MKRLVPLILALLLLTACAAETPPEVSAPTPEPTPTVEHADACADVRACVPARRGL